MEEGGTVDIRLRMNLLSFLLCVYIGVVREWRHQA